MKSEVAVMLVRALGLAALATAVVSAKTPKNIYTILVSPPVRAEDVQVRYTLAGKFGTVEGWRAEADERELIIRTERAGTPAKSIKGVVFAPACGFQPIADEDLSTGPREYELPCEAPGVVKSVGHFSRPAQWRTLQVNVEIHYFAPWVRRFIGGEGPVPDFLVSTAAVDQSGNFSLRIPDFTKSAGPERMDGLFSLIVREATSGEILGTLQPPAELSSGAGLKLAGALPERIEFGLLPAR